MASATGVCQVGRQKLGGLRGMPCGPRVLSNRICAKAKHVNLDSIMERNNTPETTCCETLQVCYISWSGPHQGARSPSVILIFY